MQNFAGLIYPRGQVTVEKWEAPSGPVEKQVFPNLIVNSGRSVMVNLMLGVWPSTSAVYQHALGTGSAIPTASNTSLQYETGRKFIKTRSAEDFYARFVTFYDTTEANGTAYEQALFAGTGAGVNSANSGNLVSRVTGAFAKTNTQNMRIVWRILMASATA